MKMKYSEFISLDYEYIFEYYDFPLFFISKNKDQQLFLNYYIEEVDDIDKWFISRITTDEMNQLLAKEKEVKSFLIKLISDKRMNYLYVNHKDEVISFHEIDKMDLEDLPLEDFYVDYDYISNSEINYVNEFEVTSNEMNVVIRDQNDSHLIDVDLLTKTLNSFQDYFDSLTDGLINLRVSAFYPSSFGVKLIADDDIFDSSHKKIETALIMLNNIKDKNINNIKDNLLIDKAYSIDSLNKARKLAKLISSENVSLEIKAIGPEKNSFIINKSDKGKFESIAQIVKEFIPINEKNINVQGVLTSINTNRNYFSITGEDERKYSGKLQQELKDNLTDNQFIVPALIKAELLKIETFDIDKDEYNVKYEMISFDQSNI